MLLKSIFFISLIASLSACQSSGQQSKASQPNKEITKLHNNKPTRRSMSNALWEKKEILLVYGTQTKEAKSQYENLVSKIPKKFRFGQIITKADTELSLEDIKNNIVYLLGTVQSNKWLNILLADFPISISDQKIKFENRNYTHPSDLLRISFYPNPFNSQIPFFAMIGNSDKLLIQHLKNKYKKNWNNLIWPSWGYEIYHQERRELLGYFSSDDWRIDQKLQWDFSDPGDSSTVSAHFRFISHAPKLDQEKLQQIAKVCEQTVVKMQNFIGTKKAVPIIDYHIYESVEQKGLMLNNTDHAHFDFRKNAVHTIINEAFKNNFVQEENTLLLRHWLGEPKSIFFEKGLAIHFTKKWQRLGYLHWAKRLIASGNALSLEILLDNELFEKESKLVTDCLSGVLVNFLLEHWGKEKFLTKYTTWQATTQEIANLQKPWKDYLSKLIPNPSAHLATKTTKALPYLKGFNFAHEGYQIYNGYTSNMAIQSLIKLTDLGSNAIAIVPYTFMRDVNKASNLHFEHSPGGENDEGLIHSLFEAKQLGMSTMMKPQIWVNKSWPGDIEMKSAAEWDQFFEHYTKWILHFALLSEIHEVESLCLGVELSKSTLQQEAHWREIIRKIRAVYSGHLTYAANWGEEFEQIKFWDDLDFIGLNCYYPLSSKENVSKRELKAGFKKTIAKIEQVAKRYNKTIVFTEIGFRSVDQTWINPHEASNGRAFNEDAQKQCYEIVFEAIHNKKWCGGILWWKWPSYLDNRRKNNTAFTPHNKSTEVVIEKWFGKL